MTRWHQRGFTLIELVVSVGIVGLLLATGIPAFRGYGSRVALDNAAQAIAQAITQAQTLALAPEADKRANILAYGLTFDATGTYTIARYSEDQTTGDCNFVRVSDVSTSLLPGGLQFSQIPKEIIFPIDGQGEPARCEAEMVVGVRHDRLTRANTRLISVQPVSGQVTIRQGAVQ